MTIKYTVDLEWEQVEAIVVKELKWTRDQFKKDLAYRRLPVFDHDKDTDDKLIKKHIKALDMIIEYYGGDKNEDC